MATKERPILFNGPMVRAILDGSKTQTRRVVGLDTLSRSGTPGYDWTWRGQAPVRSIAQQQRGPRGCWQDLRHADFLRLCPYGEPGSRLWVQETFAVIPAAKPAGYFTDPKWKNRIAWYAADNDRPTWGGSKWRPSIFMPRGFSRITLEVTDVRVERVQNISHEDAKSEGVEEWATDRELPLREQRLTLHQLSFSHLWDDLNAARGFGWDSNPWVWVVSFRRDD